ncbi:hypothetical protein MetMK1DRAFT_00010160 [Metallosphaera yellowstonensis MK1]|uniref:Uncharacterized protein n=1 Tax=Metallosphaera yellowstonensis MK1 TaxID=671065 RepID=H2C2P2_9CREN|nr:hypothetical protein MetMK1DRAFT_00010160 [Metallosphaera yellowstonensis MK1]
MAAVIRFCLDYRAIFKGKSHNCCDGKSITAELRLVLPGD